LHTCEDLDHYAKILGDTARHQVTDFDLERGDNFGLQIEHVKLDFVCRVNGELDVGLGGFWAELANTAALTAAIILPVAGFILCGVVYCVRGKKLWCGRRIEQDPEEADPARDRPASAERIRLEDIPDGADEQVINEVAAGNRLDDEQGVDAVNASNLEAHRPMARNLIRRSSQASPVDDHIAEDIHTNV